MKRRSAKSLEIMNESNDVLERWDNIDFLTWFGFVKINSGK